VFWQPPSYSHQFSVVYTLQKQINVAHLYFHKKEHTDALEQVFVQWKSSNQLLHVSMFISSSLSSEGDVFPPASSKMNVIKHTKSAKMFTFPTKQNHSSMLVTLQGTNISIHIPPKREVPKIIDSKSAFFEGICDRSQEGYFFVQTVIYQI